MLVAALVSLIAVPVTTKPVSPVPDSATIVTTIGQDTVALERYELTPGHLVGDILLRAPRTIRYHYAIDFRRDGGLSRSVLDLSEPGVDDAPHIRTTIAVEGTAARVTVDSSGVSQSATRTVSPSVMPGLMTGFGSDYGLYISFGMYQGIAATLGPERNEVVDVPVIDAANGSLRTKHLVRKSATDVDVDYFRIAWTHLTVDDRGRIERADASGTTEKTHSVRSGPVNIDSAEKVFAQRDRAGASLGQLSPQARATAQLGSARITVRYNSPRRRGRQILGTTIPFGAVWRTGANAATELIVDQPVTIGGRRIPAGTYTLWTIPEGPDRATLIINGQHGQWGTNYDPSQDVARTAMQVKRGQPVQEDFVISLSGSGSTGQLRMAWDDFVWTVPVTVR